MTSFVKCEKGVDKGDRKKEVANHSPSQTQQFQKRVHIHKQVQDQKPDSLKTVHALWPLEDLYGHQVQVLQDEDSSTRPMNYCIPQQRLKQGYVPKN